MSFLFRRTLISIPRSTSRTTPKSARTSLSISRSQFKRTMASAPSSDKFEWLIIMPDQPDKLPKRMEVRPAHFEGLKTSNDSGMLKMGGAILDSVPKDGEGLKINGSALVLLASSKEECIEYLKKDIYAKSEVWDFSKIQIYPFKCAIRQPLDQ